MSKREVAEINAESRTTPPRATANVRLIVVGANLNVTVANVAAPVPAASSRD